MSRAEMWLHRLITILALVLAVLSVYASRELARLTIEWQDDIVEVLTNRAIKDIDAQQKVPVCEGENCS